MVLPLRSAACCCGVLCSPHYHTGQQHSKSCRPPTHLFSCDSTTVLAVTHILPTRCCRSETCSPPSPRWPASSRAARRAVRWARRVGCGMCLVCAQSPCVAREGRAATRAGRRRARGPGRVETEKITEKNHCELARNEKTERTCASRIATAPHTVSASCASHTAACAAHAIVDRRDARARRTTAAR